MRIISNREFCILGLSLLWLVGCAGTPTPAEHMAHEGKQGGKIGMGSAFHVEVVSTSSAEYRLYLFDSVGKPLSLQGVKVEAALIDAAGKESPRLAVALSEKGDSFIAKGGPNGLALANVRVKVTLRGKSEPEAVDVSMQYQTATNPTTASVGAPTRAQIVPPTVAAAQPRATFVPGRFPQVKWSEAASGLTAGASFEPCPPQMGNQITFTVVLADANGQPVSDAVVEITVTGGMATMMGEHDENFSAKLQSQGGGVYRTRESFGPTNLALFGISMSVKRNSQSWTFVLPDVVFTNC